jgi:hypothetical protein
MPTSSRFDIEDPGKTDDQGKTTRECADHVGEHGVGPVQPVHDRLSDLEDGE